MSHFDYVFDMFYFLSHAVGSIYIMFFYYLINVCISISVLISMCVFAHVSGRFISMNTGES